MEIKFTKMQGIGNDYIYINAFETLIDNPESLAIKLSDRHFGIGGDGIILVMPSDIADAKMRMFNLDGSEGKMCGNGIRCVAKFLFEKNIVKKTKISVETLSGIKHLDLTVEKDEVTSVKVDMGNAILEPSKIPVILQGDMIVNKDFKIEENNFSFETKITCVSMGNPHCVIFGKDLDKLNLETIGPYFEKNDIFPENTNTEFIEVIDEKTLKMRVWERGSGETLACGTGACASVVAAVLNGFCKKNTDVTVQLLGGELIINYSDETVLMTGPCKIVFEGTVKI